MLNIKHMSIGRISRALARRVSYLPWLIYYYLPWGFSAKNRKRLEQWQNIHKGQRCFIIANGPSLKKIDFSLLKNEITIGMNRIYLMKEENGFSPTYLACHDIKTQIMQFHQELDKLDIPCFFNFTKLNLFSRKLNQYFMFRKFTRSFNKTISGPFGSGKSVTYACIQLAFHMGFSEVYLIGKDHSYNTGSAKMGDRIPSEGSEDNHFIRGYYKPGMVWGMPDYKAEEFAYKVAKITFEKNNRIIKDATIDGKLNVFEKVSFTSLFT